MECSPEKKKKKKKHVVVLVLGDIGRSPRMQYHTQSLLEHGHYITLIGYVGERLIPTLEKTSSSDDDSNENNEHSSSSTLAAAAAAANKTYHKRLRVLRMKPHHHPSSNKRSDTTIWGRLFYYPLRLTSLLYSLCYTLWIQLNQDNAIPVDVILVQNPPSVPTLLVVYLYCVWEGIWRKKRPRFVIDWHNLGKKDYMSSSLSISITLSSSNTSLLFSLQLSLLSLSLSLGYTMFETPTQQTSFLRTIALNSLRIIAKTYERILAPLADAHLTVTHAMEVWLGEHFNVHGTNVRVLYDKPPLLFRPTTIEEEHELFQRLDLEGENGQLHGWMKNHHDGGGDDDLRNEQTTPIEEETLFTQCILHNSKRRTIQPRPNRPALLVSSTSWTPDEDFSVLLDALEKLHTLIILSASSSTSSTSSSSFPNILVVVTGKGPQKDYFLPLLHQFNEQHHLIQILTLWLESSDYPKLLGCATLGVCLHTSTSGLDLPMKVLDMFGCQVPVCAIGFDCLDELVKDGINGRVFCNGEELARQLFDLLQKKKGDDDDDYDDDDDTRKELERFRQNIRGMTRWKENWDECAKHLIVGDF